MGGAFTFGSGSSGRETFSDDELTTLALAADPDMKLSADAISLWDLLGPADSHAGRAVLPQWYMPSPMAGARPVRRPWHRRVALLVIVSFLVIDAFGLCITYGQLVLA